MTEKWDSVSFPDLPSVEVRSYQTIDSTNRAALEWALEGAADLSLVTALEQTSGRGRMQRRWISNPNSCIAMSLIICPTKAEQSVLHLFSPLAGLAVAESLQQNHLLKPFMKWPNDILIDGKKVCGILCESAWNGSVLEGMVIGIGMNLRKEAIPPIENQNFPAGSLETAGCTNLDTKQHIHEIIQKFIMLRPILTTPDFLTRWEQFLAYKNQKITLSAINREPEICTLIGLDSQGNLLVEDQQGQRRSYIAGEISLRPVQESIQKNE